MSPNSNFCMVWGLHFLHYSIHVYILKLTCLLHIITDFAYQIFAKMNKKVQGVSIRKLVLLGDLTLNLSTLIIPICI